MSHQEDNSGSIPSELQTANEISRGIVSDVIAGLRSGSVEVFHNLTTGSRPLTELRNDVDTRCDNDTALVSADISPKSNGDRVHPMVAGLVRVQAPYSAIDSHVPQLPSDDENEFMLSIGDSVKNASDDSSCDTQLASLGEPQMSSDDTDSSAKLIEEETQKDFAVIKPAFREDEEYIKMIASQSSGPVTYGGGCGQIDTLLGDKLMIDRLFLPHRDDGIFKEGVRKKTGARHVFLHPRDMVSHAYLQTSQDGVLHVLPGWDHDSFIRDISYRYKTVHTYDGPVPFLGGDQCRIRKYRCVGVLVCPASSEAFQAESHFKVDPEDKNILRNLEDRDPSEIAKKKVVAIFNSLKERRERKNGVVCGVAIPDPKNPLGVVACKGQAVLVPRRSVPTAFQEKPCYDTQIGGTTSIRRCDYFVGCSGYHEDHDRLKVRHYARSLDIENHYVPYLRRLLNGEEGVLVDPGSCNYVRDKNKGRRTCPRHNMRLIEVLCKNHDDDKGGHHEMTTFEPLGQQHLPIESKILYVSCRGKHVHPPPPPPEATVRKLRLIEEIQNKTGITCNGKLRKEVQRRILTWKEGSATDGVSRFNGSLSVTASAVTKVLKRIHPPLSKMGAEIGELAIMATNGEMPFVRDSRMVDNGYVFFLGIDRMLEHASTAISFAGDATFRTVSEANCVRNGRWYLYNIVAHASNDRVNGSGVVVMRALMTGLSMGYYFAIWKYFFSEIAKAKNRMNGEKDADLACIRVPYVNFTPAIKTRACLVASITMDFDLAEIGGCAWALRDLCGGSIETHLRTGFIGCEVHLKRDFLRRARGEDTQKKSGMSSSQLYEEYNAFAYAKSRACAEAQLEKIKSFDPAWVKWVQENYMGPLMSPSLSDMSPTYRTIAFSNTNVVESHNRRGNHLVGTRLRPGEAAKRLYELDKIDAEELGGDRQNTIAEVGVRRQRTDSILKPVGTSKSRGRKRSKAGGGPVQKKTRTRKGSPVTKVPFMDSGTRQSIHEKRDSEKEYELISARLQEGVTKLTDRLRKEDGPSITPEQRVARLDTLVQILAGVHAASSCDKVDMVKQALLEGLKSNRGDIEFREELLHLCISCFGLLAPREEAKPSLATNCGEISIAQPQSSVEVTDPDPAENVPDIAGTNSNPGN